MLMPIVSVSSVASRRASAIVSVSLRSTARVLVLAFWGLFAISWLTACAASEAEVQRAKRAGYKTDFATVYGEVLQIVVKHYPRATENAVDGVIATAWHRVAVQTGSQQSRRNRNGSGNLAGTQASSSITTNVSIDRKQYYIRFRIYVMGGKPWRVRIRGEASEWAAGDVPMPLRGAEVPHWLKGRTDALQVEIYKHLKNYAVDLGEEIPEAQGTIVSISAPPSFGAIPAQAQVLLEALHHALITRSFEELREQLAPDVEWSPGEAGSADVAIAIWQADTNLLDAMLDVMGRGCETNEEGQRVICPREHGDDPNGDSLFRLIVEKGGDGWAVTAFTKTQ